MADLGPELTERTPLPSMVVAHEGNGVSVICNDVVDLDIERLEAWDHATEEGQDLFLPAMRAGVRTAPRHVPHDVIGEGVGCPVGSAATPQLVQMTQTRCVWVLGHDALPVLNCRPESMHLTRPEERDPTH